MKKFLFWIAVLSLLLLVACGKSADVTWDQLGQRDDLIVREESETTDTEIPEADVPLPAPGCDRVLESPSWRTEVYESVLQSEEYLLQTRSYCHSNGTDLRAVRLTGTAENAPLLHFGFREKAQISFFDEALGQWTQGELEPGDYRALIAYLELPDGRSWLVQFPRTFRSCENGVIELQRNKSGVLRVAGGSGHWDLTLLCGSCGEGEFCDAMLEESDEPLITRGYSDNVLTCFARYANSIEAVWCFDGYYRFTPTTYVPSGTGRFYHCPASYLANTIRTLPEAQAADLSILVSMMDTLCLQQNEDGFWPTTPESTWLKTDFGIPAGFYDTRFNTDAVQLLRKVNDLFGGGLFNSAIERYADFYQSFAGQAHLETKNGGWLVQDYWSKQVPQRTHTSLNHQAAECLLLYHLGLQFGRDDLIDTAKKLLLGIEDTGTEWVMEDHNFYYSREPDGTYNTGDYPALTYNDLLDLQVFLQRNAGRGSEVIAVLLTEKKFWMQANNVTNYHLVEESEEFTSEPTPLPEEAASEHKTEPSADYYREEWEPRSDVTETKGDSV